MTQANAPQAAWRKAQGEGTLSADIIAQIQDRVFAGLLRPGDYLGSEASLAESFGVSRMAMRDALRGLVTTGLIEIRRGYGGGVRIANGNIASFANALATQFTLLGATTADLIEAQIATEAMITGLAAERADSKDVAELRAVLARAGCETGDGASFVLAINEFHAALSRIARNMVLAVILQGTVQLLASMRMEAATPDVADYVLRTYAGVVDAIEAGDARTAASQMREHLERVGRHRPAPATFAAAIGPVS